MLVFCAFECCYGLASTNADGNNSMIFRQIYAMNLWTVCILMMLVLTGWTLLCIRLRTKVRIAVNAILFCVSAAIILHITILSRTPGTHTTVLTPFAALVAARYQPELYREMLMNVFLFFPQGLTLSNALPQRWNRRCRIILTTLIGCVLSTGVEYAQYRFTLGMAETDDVICNTLGAFIGATSLLSAYAIEKHNERSTTMTLTATETQFIHIAKVAFSHGELHMEDVDWSAIFTLAVQQKLLPILFEGVRNTPAAEENAALFETIRQQVIGQVLNQTVRSVEFADLYRKLRNNGLHPIVVKGQLCSRLYPLRDYRISADDDIFIPDGELFSCHEALLANGLTTDTPEDELSIADEISYTKKDSPLYIELHRHLFDSAEDAHDELNRFFMKITPMEIDDFLTMPPHEHLLYLILHAYKHFVRSGIGLRQFCDIGLWAQTYHEQIDWQRLYDQCDSVHAATFATATFRSARAYLGIEFDLPELWNSNIDVEPLLHDALCGGVYGSNDYTRLHSSTMTLNAVKASRNGKKSSILRTVFPERAYLERRYPYLKKRPYLLPMAWGQRIAHYAWEKQFGKNDSASGSIRLARERIELMKLYDIIE